MHNDLTETIASHTFVGIVDERRRIAAIQGGVKLFLVDYGMLCNEYFYQVGLTDFGNFGSIKFKRPLDLMELLKIAARHEADLVSKDGDGGEDIDFEDDVPATVAQQLIHRRDMLAEYFSIEISAEGELVSIPLLVKGYMPCLAKLPRFLLRLGPYVDWTDEQACFHSFLRELASFYVPEQLPPPPPSPPPPQLPGDSNKSSSPAKTNQAAQENSTTTEDEESSQQQQERSEEEPAATEPLEIAARRAHIRRALEHVLFPAFRARLVATRGLLKRGVVEVANLKGLYRVFERC